GLRLRKGDRLSWELPPTTPSRLQAEAMDLRVLYEDDDLVVIDKPAGLVVHPGPGHATGTLVHGLLARGAGWSTIGGAERPGIVHRLDRDTSGLIVVARNDATHRALTRQAPIGRDVKHRQRMVVVAGGREAITEFIRLGVAGGHSLLQVSLTTGRTHQIRVHLAFIKHPVLGDPVYGHRSPLIGRPALHAETLTLRHPRTGKSMTWQAAPPEDFELAWNSLSVRTMR
ncbi:MAG: RluA family pseudouridine synthase, partial [Chloroflexi bacterium]